jgi:hypothetical protein
MSRRYGFIGTALSSTLALGCGSSGSGAAGPVDAGPNATDSGADVGVESSGIDAGPPIPNLTEQTWTWVDFPAAHCRDGSSTGIGINANSASKKLMIFLAGGGACFNPLTCAMNPSCFAGTAGSCANTFPSLVTGTGSAGIFNRADMANPVKDWNFVYVPYCTGDVHAGNNPNGSVSGVTGTQQFVGYANVAQYLTRLVPTFPGLTQVLLTGVSAGGFGAAANYVPVARAFAPVPVSLLDDSGPPMNDPYAAKCLQQQWVQTWGLDKTLLADCGSDCPDPSNFTIDATKHAAKLFPNAPYGVVEDTADNTITLFFGFGQNSCMAATPIPTPLSQQQFTAGLTDMRMQLSANPKFGAFIFAGTDHTTLTSPTFDTRTAGNVLLTDWIKQLVDSGTVTNVGPP